MMETITCMKCQSVKTLSEYDNTTRRLKYSGEIKYYSRRVCKTCRLAARRESNRLRSHLPEVKRSKRLRELTYRYNITVEEYLELVEKQENLCAICGEPPRSKALGVDHDHTTGKVRALLCTDCNFGIGWFRDDYERMELAIKYIKSYSKSLPLRQPLNRGFKRLR